MAQDLDFLSLCPQTAKAVYPLDYLSVSLLMAKEVCLRDSPAAAKAASAMALSPFLLVSLDCRGLILLLQPSAEDPPWGQVAPRWRA